MKSILVPYDGSRSAKRALGRAIQLARVSRAAVRLLNVESELDDYGMVGAYLDRGTHRKAMLTRAHALLRPAERRLKHARIRYESHVAFGDPARAIARMARTLRCQAIVMGTRGMGAIGNLALGSVATKTVHLSRLPVTLIH